MELTPYDKESVTWLKLKAHYAARLQALRLTNDNAMLEAERNQVIGQILEVKTLLRLDEDAIDMSGL